MARIGQHDVFDPAAHGQPVVGIQAELAQHDSGRHAHPMGQLLYARHGSMRISLRTPPQLSLLPPSLAAWIPAGVPHRVQLRQVVGYRSVYFDPLAFPQLPSDCRVLQVGPLLHELLERICALPFATDWQAPAHAALATLAAAEIQQAPVESLSLPLPRDRRLAQVLDGRRLPPPLAELAQHAGASERTLSRVVKAETGMSYQQWRQQWRSLRAVELLSQGRSLAYTAQAVGFASESAFIAFFGEQRGCSPAAWQRARSQPTPR